MTRRMLALRLLSLWGIVVPYCCLLLGVIVMVVAYPEGFAPWAALFVSLVIVLSLATAIAFSVGWVRAFRLWRAEHP